MIRFGTDGIRGRAGWMPCTPEVALKVGRAAGRLARAGGGTKVLVARDTRPSGRLLESAVAAGVAAEGAVTLLAGVLPTSGVGACLRKGLADAGVMITASHNPAGDNGFKVLGRGGRKLTDAQTTQFEVWLGEDPDEGEFGRFHRAHQEAWGAYKAQLRAALPPVDTFAGRRLAVDFANGAVTPGIEWLMDTIPAQWTVVGDGDGAINDGCGSEDLKALKKAVVGAGCEAGFAIDGDGDRCVLVDERGRKVHGDRLAWLLATGRDVQGIAVTVMSTGALEQALPGVRVVRTPVGDRHLLAAMESEGLPLGCEESGHVLFDDALPGGDGLVTGLRALALAFAMAATVSEALAPFKPWPSKKVAVPIGHRPPLEEVKALQAARAEGERSLAGRGRILLRYSGTEPVLRILVEGADEEVVGDVAERLTAAAEEALG